MCRNFQVVTENNYVIKLCFYDVIINNKIYCDVNNQGNEECCGTNGFDTFESNIVDLTYFILLIVALKRKNGNNNN